MAWRRLLGFWWLGSLGLALGLVRCGARSTLQGVADDPDAQSDAGLDTGVDAPAEVGPPDARRDVAPDVPSINPGLGEACDGSSGGPVGCAPGLSCWRGDRNYEDGERWPGGYCTLECYSDGPCTSWGGVCAGLEYGGAGHCMLECDEPADCRQGYACIPAGNASSTACVPTGFIATRGPGEACFQHDDPGGAHYLPPPALGFGENQLVYPADLQDEVVLALDGAQNVVVGANAISNFNYQNPAYYGNGAPPNISFQKSTGPYDATSAYYSDPYLVVGADGTFYYSTLGIASDRSSVRLLIGRSDNQGASFSTVHANPAADCNPDPAGLEGVCLDHPWLAIGKDKLDPTSEALYAAYLATRPNDYACVLLRSTDGGRSWGIPDSPDTSLSVFSLNELGLFVNLITPAVDEVGDVHMVAVGVLGDTRGSTLNAIYYARSEDGGKSRTQPVVVNDFGEAIPFDQPVIAVDGSTIWVAYSRGGSDGAWDIVLAKSTDGGQVFSYEVVNDEPEPCATHFHPAIAVDPVSHRVFVGWYDGRYAPYEGYVAYSVCDPSLPAGSICSENRAINDVPFYITTDRNTLAFIGDYFGLAAAGGELWAAWGDTRFDFLSRAFLAKASTP